MPFKHVYANTKPNSAGRKYFAVLLDPDNLTEASCLNLIALSETHPVDFFFVGGSLVTSQNQAAIIHLLKAHSTIPVILFPSNSQHIDAQADGILLLSLISGRNSDFLIGQHVVSAPMLKASRLEVYPTGYMLVDTGRQTTASYMSGTMPIPYDKPAIAACTAMAGELLGLQYIYMDGGSGAKKPIAPEMIAAVREAVDLPLVVGGGINNTEKAAIALEAGADVIVIGNHIEKNPGFLAEVSSLVSSYNVTLDIRR
ncbi:geranylgeranylglyceryl/heptaprenylglyceryl phosphate synthase [Pontibacter akesuensis]|uniref:Geranylgeranylglyceryl phosphate synthase n=1 Tax=Pontibacter akesuensis TaxID=388950 RepID=A0A1I7HXY5_9BACT|nr:geranylgeranylglyceryl/heptaprenylglyceryl phosphate synthase [Pontibacter akesuensis]GHA64091.1 geranylgeranylglyceryl phosphate synthase [Pontibacter akesuensis]SFU65497.1 putative glycerol-1-phosphate prenyltransferase [Pontibacter akesuensis]